MIIADLNIVCIGQKKELFPPNVQQYIVESHNRNAFHRRPLYHSENYSNAYRQVGWWYTFWPKDVDFFENPFFDIAPEISRKAIRLRPEWKNSIISLLNFYLNESPKKKLCVLIRLQGTATSAVCKDYSVDGFTQELLVGKIMCNTVYFIEEKL